MIECGQEWYVYFILSSLRSFNGEFKYCVVHIVTTKVLETGNLRLILQPWLPWCKQNVDKFLTS